MSDKSNHNSNDGQNISADLLFARQPIFDADKKLFAFELLYRDNDPDSVVIEDGDKATASLIMNYCGSILEDNESPHVKVFINLTRKLLLSDFFFPIDPNRIVVEILEDTIVDQRLIDRIIELKEQGYRFALDDYTFCDTFTSLIPLVDYIKVELLDVSLEAMSEKLLAFEESVCPKLDSRPIMLAEKVEDQQAFDHCEKLGFQLFQGFFLERPLPVYGTKIDNNSEIALQILAQLQSSEIDIDMLSRSISRDAKLSYQILKIVNSPLCRLSKKVSSLHEAVVFLGLEQVKKWAMTMVLSGNSERNSELFLFLLTRARCCELVASRLNKSDAESNFTVGLFSGIDAVLLAEKSWLLSKLDLAEDLNDAILNYQGEKGLILKQVIELERQDLESLMNLDNQTQKIYYRSQEEALQWAQQICNSL
ncbi:MAG: HDOD domain-containing protein [Kangiellaceae bacterium]|nr:HDOD domain-containing protein [Kangiellaceae bacterium]